MRKDFVANVSHELRTPIATVLSAAETLHRAGLEDETANEFVQIIERNAERLRQLVEDLLDLSRIEAKEFHFKLEPIELAPLVQHVFSIYREQAAAKRVSLVARVEARAKVKADRRALEQILCNLVDNAVKYTSESSTVTLRSDTEDGWVCIEVADTGPGIEAKHLPRLFERFYRADAGRSRAVGGTGLGLSIVKNLAEAMTGSVDVESQPGSGSTFSVKLPNA
jgi:two-component system phosphate regulon sensor histidine kinase PhoR